MNKINVTHLNASIRSRSGPEAKYQWLGGDCSDGVAAKGKAEVVAPAFICQVPSLTGPANSSEAQINTDRSDCAADIPGCP
jgi:hypothetical protein